MKKKNIFILLVLIILLLTISITLFIIFKNKKSNNTTYPLNNQIINEIDNNFSEHLHSLMLIFKTIQTII